MEKATVNTHHTATGWAQKLKQAIHRRKERLVAQRSGQGVTDQPHSLQQELVVSERFLFFISFFLIVIIIWLHREAYRIVVPWPGIEPRSPAVEA